MADPSTPIKILSIDGGGIRGIIAARILKEIERLKGKPLGKIFDLIAGTSTGGIIACGLTRPGGAMTASEMLDLYTQRGAEIFHRSLWKVVSSIGGVIDEKYPAEPLEAILKEILRDYKLSDVRDTRLLVTSYAIELPPSAKSQAVPDSTRAPYFFKSWNMDKPSQPPPKQWDFFLRDVARATSAAPTYFPPASIENLAKEHGAMIDGGVIANNPAMCAYAEAVRLFPNRKYLVVSVGAGELERDIPLRDAENWGLIEWARPILSVLMDGSCDTVTYQLKQILGNDLCRLDISLGTRSDPQAALDDLDNTSPDNIARLVRRAEMLINQITASGELDTLIARL